MDKIIEIFPDEIPEWAQTAIDNGCFMETVIARDKLAVEAFEWLACLGNKGSFGNSEGNRIALDALKELR